MDGPRPNNSGPELDDSAIAAESEKLSGARILSDAVRDRAGFLSLARAIGMGEFVVFMGTFPDLPTAFFAPATLAAVIAGAVARSYGRDARRKNVRDALRHSVWSRNEEDRIEADIASLSWNTDLSDLFVRFLPVGTIVTAEIPDGPHSRYVMAEKADDSVGVLRAAKEISDRLPLGCAVDIALPWEAAPRRLRYSHLREDIFDLLVAIRANGCANIPRDDDTP